MKEYETDSLAEGLNAFFEHMVNVERIKVGKRQTIDMLISEEALLFAKYLRNEKKRMDSQTAKFFKHRPIAINFSYEYSLLFNDKFGLLVVAE